MGKVTLRKTNIKRRELRVRKKVYGTQSKPRLSIYRSLRYIYAQLIDDVTGRTLVDISNSSKKMQSKETKSKASFEAGKMLAEKAVKKNIKEVVFDRNGYRYHGRVKSFADGAREGGLRF